MNSALETYYQLKSVGTLSLEDARNYTAWAAVGVLPVAGLVATIDKFRQPTTFQDGISGADIELLPQVNEIKRGRTRSWIGRWAGIGLLASSVALYGANELDPTIETKTKIAGSAAMVLIDGSNSSVLTADMDGGLTRKDAAQQAIAPAAKRLPQSTRIGVAVFADKAIIQTPLTVDKSSLTNPVDTSVLDGNGGNLSAAISLASDVLEASSSEGQPVPNNIIVITDGTIDPDPNLAATIEAAKKNNQVVTVILTGTEGGTYKRTQYDLNPANSGVTDVQIRGIEGIGPLRATSTSQIEKAIFKTVDKTISNTERKPFKLFKNLGATLLGSALLSFSIRAYRREDLQRVNRVKSRRK